MKRKLWLAVLAVPSIAMVASVQAATISVAAGQVAVAVDGQCSLREAINNAETDSDTSGGDCVAGSGADTINLAAGTYVVPDIAITDPDYGSSGLPHVNSSIVINGTGSIIQRDTALFTGTACGGAGAKFRLFYVGPTANLTLNNMTLRYGCADFGATGAGGALFNRGTLSMDRTTVTANMAAYSGGGIHSDGTLALTRSTVSNNSLPNTEDNGAGGGIASRGTVQITESTINGNSAYGAGGGLNFDDGQATITNSTVSGNLSAGNGGGIFNQTQLTTRNTTVADNTGTRYADADTSLGSGVYDMGTTNLQNTLLANQHKGTNCAYINTSTASLSDDSSCNTVAFNAGASNIGALAANGGPTLTHALLAGNPAINSGDNAVAAGLTTDQRGTGFARILNTIVDIGAFEYRFPNPLANIPTLSPWGLLAVMLLLSGAAYEYIRRRQAQG